MKKPPSTYPTRRIFAAGLVATLLTSQAAWAQCANTRGWVQTRCGGKILEKGSTEVLAEIPKGQGAIIVPFGDDAGLTISLRRTVRTPPEGNTVNGQELLPNRINDIPLYTRGEEGSHQINSEAESITAPMYPEEAFYFRWGQKNTIVAAIPIMNGRNMVNGKEMNADTAQMEFGDDQNYVIIENHASYHDSQEKTKKHAKGLPWLDQGISKEGKIGQLVTSEKTGETSSLSLKDNPAITFLFIPMKEEFYKQIKHTKTRQLGGGEKAAQGQPTLSIKPGGIIQQQTPKDPFIAGRDPKDVWNTEGMKTLKFSIPEATAFYKLSGQKPPKDHYPLTIEDYKNHKWFPTEQTRDDLVYKEHVDAIFGSQNAPTPKIEP